MKKLFFIFFFLANIQGFAQKYTPDRIKIDGKDYDYRFHHLEQYFNYYPDKRIIPTKDSTIFNRGYVAYYELFENEIFLRDIQTSDTKNPSNHISIRNKFSSSDAERIPLRWINGVIQIGMGKDDLQKDSLQPLNTNNLIVEIQRGKVKRKLNFNKNEMRIFKNMQWNIYKNTYEYLVIKYKLKKLNLSEIEIEQHIYNNVLYYSKRIFLTK